MPRDVKVKTERSLEEVAQWLETMRTNPVIGNDIEELIAISRRSLLAVVYVAVNSHIRQRDGA